MPTEVPLIAIAAERVTVLPLLLALSVAWPVLVKTTRAVLLAPLASSAPKLTVAGLKKLLSGRLLLRVRVSAPRVPLPFVRVTVNDKGVPTVAELLAAVMAKDAPLEAAAPTHQAVTVLLTPSMRIAGVLLLPI